MRNSGRRRFGRAVLLEVELEIGPAGQRAGGRELHAEMHAVHAARKEIARIIAACRAALRAGLSVHAGKLLRADVRNARSARSGARADDGDGREDGGVQERDAADFEDGGVGRGREVRRLIQEGRERHAADLEDVSDDDVDGNVSLQEGRRFTFSRGDLS